ncbi:MAG: hypothetical protein AAF629_03510 [Chloroflexota bacterium]
MAKKSRRARKVETAKAVASTQKAVEQSSPEVSAAIEEKDEGLLAEMDRKAVSFTQDYYYVYTDIRLLIAVTAVMIVLMVGLSFVF